MSDDVIVIRAEDVAERRQNEHERYDYTRRTVVPRRDGGSLAAAVYSVTPGKAAYPYHYHVKNDELFYILSGDGVLETPSGERAVTAGDFLFFPAGEGGAHRLSNASKTEPLVYLDVDASHDLEVSFYPKTGKIGVWGKDINQMYKIDSQVDYYEDE